MDETEFSYLLLLYLFQLNIIRIDYISIFNLPLSLNFD